MQRATRNAATLWGILPEMLFFGLFPFFVKKGV